MSLFLQAGYKSSNTLICRITKDEEEGRKDVQKNKTKSKYPSSPRTNCRHHFCIILAIPFNRVVTMAMPSAKNREREHGDNQSM